MNRLFAAAVVYLVLGLGSGLNPDTALRVANAVGADAVGDPSSQPELGAVVGLPGPGARPRLRLIRGARRPASDAAGVADRPRAPRKPFADDVSRVPRSISDTTRPDRPRPDRQPGS